MNPFERYLDETGQFDDVIAPVIPEAHAVIEPGDHCPDFDHSECVGYVIGDGWVSYCTCQCHKVKRPEIPFNHCSYLGCAQCPGLLKAGRNVSPCTCIHHERSVN
jgi:hypothetical protein